MISFTNELRPLLLRLDIHTGIVLLDRMSSLGYIGHGSPIRPNVCGSTCMGLASTSDFRETWTVAKSVDTNAYAQSLPFLSIGDVCVMHMFVVRKTLLKWRTHPSGRPCYPRNRKYPRRSLEHMYRGSIVLGNIIGITIQKR